MINGGTFLKSERTDFITNDLFNPLAYSSHGYCSQEITYYYLHIIICINYLYDLSANLPIAIRKFRYMQIPVSRYFLALQKGIYCQRNVI